MPNLYIVRHGQTENNVNNIMQGSCDSHLTIKGINDTKILARKFKTIKFDKIYSGTHGRHRATLKYLFPDGIKNLEELNGLNEWDFGSFEGKDQDPYWDLILDHLLEKGQIENKHNYLDSDDDAFVALLEKIGGKNVMADLTRTIDPENRAENYSMILKRVRQALDKIQKDVSENNYKNVLALTSGMTITTIYDIIDPGKHIKFFDNLEYRIEKVQKW